MNYEPIYRYKLNKPGTAHISLPKQIAELCNFVCLSLDAKRHRPSHAINNIDLSSV